MAQRIERGDGKAPQRAGAAFDHLREHERGEVGYVLGELAQRWQPKRELGEARTELGIEFVLLHQGAHVQRRKRHQPRLVLFRARQQELEVALLGAAQARQVGEEEDPARGLGEQL